MVNKCHHWSQPMSAWIPQTTVRRETMVGERGMPIALSHWDSVDVCYIAKETAMLGKLLSY